MGCGDSEKSCCCLKDNDIPKGGVDYIVDWYDTSQGKVGQVISRLSKADKWGAIKARFTFGRMDYKVLPGLYALGCPDSRSEVLVTANYKLSFDTLRENLKNLNVWILVLDTKGINVWCAAGKGTFGTAELIKAIRLTNLDKQVEHSRVIVPQLGAVGVCAHEIKKSTGFKVEYGPVRAIDIIAYLKAGRVATDKMRQVQFTLYDRAILAPAEFVNWWKYLAVACVVFLILAGFSSQGFSLALFVQSGTRAVLNLLAAYLCGTVLGPLVLPVLPGRSFSLKGFYLGIVFVGLLFAVGLLGANLFEKSAWGLMVVAVSSFVLMNFTGSSTYTSLSGVRKEMKVVVPLQLFSIVLGIVLWIVSKFI